MLALSLTALMIIAALVLDGGQGYSERRQMQNAADAAAMAGTRALDQYRFPPAGSTPDYTTIGSQVSQVATANGATSVTACRLINSTRWARATTSARARHRPPPTMRKAFGSR